ncbi:MAG: hypothetical protein PHR83_08725 [Paludibacter sp.]|nr:hypothetical protein [Paludibacter sp.]
MEAIIGLLELAGGIIFFFAAGLLFARISGYGEFYDKMLYDEESDAYITFKRYKMDNNINNDEDLIHQFYI